MSDAVNPGEQTERVAVLYVRDFPPELHTDLRVEAAMSSEESMRDIVIAAVRVELERRKAERKQGGKR